MAIPHAKPGEVVDIRSLGAAFASAQTKTLVRADQVEVIRLVVPAGKEVEEHKAKGEIIVQCLARIIHRSGQISEGSVGQEWDVRSFRVYAAPRKRPPLPPMWGA